MLLWSLGSDCIAAQHAKASAIMKNDEAAVTLAKRKNLIPGSGSLSVDDSPLSPYKVPQGITVLAVGRAVRLESLRCKLEAKDYLVLEASHSIEALSLLEKNVPGLIILDFSFGCIDNWHLLEAFRERIDVPIIGLLDLDDVTKEINAGLERGIDDYVPSSVDCAELDLRIQVVLTHAERHRRQIVKHERRSNSDRRRSPLGRRVTDRQKALISEADRCHSVGPFKVDEPHKIVTVNGEELRLTPNEYKLLKLFLAKPECVLTKDEIMALLWPRSSRATSSDVQQLVHLLRRKVEKNPKKPRWIKTVKGFGYRFCVD